MDWTKFSVADVVIAASIVAIETGIDDFGVRLRRVLETPSNEWFTRESVSEPARCRPSTMDQPEVEPSAETVEAY